MVGEALEDDTVIGKGWGAVLGHRIAVDSYNCGQFTSICVVLSACELDGLSACELDGLSACEPADQLVSQLISL